MILEYKLESLNSIALDVLKTLKHRVVLFDGAMGTGKTTLIKALAKELGSTDVISSPTFSLVNTYTTANLDIYHFDLYRLNAIEEAYDFGIEDYLDSNNWLFIEWPDIIKPLLSDDYHIISLKQLGTEKRQLTLK